MEKTIMSDKATDDIGMGKFISLILRHKPETVDISLNEHGWADVSELIAGIRKSGRYIDIAMLERIVAENNKQRYSFNDDCTKIRANQGHSIPVDIELPAANPPDVLYHGTATRFLDSIREKGILRQNRQYVHLSSDIKTALDVGKRHGKAVVLPINAKKMAEDGYVFYLSVNRVWLCGDIAWKYVKENEIINQGK